MGNKTTELRLSGNYWVEFLDRQRISVANKMWKRVRLLSTQSVLHCSPRILYDVVHQDTCGQSLNICCMSEWADANVILIRLSWHWPESMCGRVYFVHPPDLIHKKVSATHTVTTLDRIWTNSHSVSITAPSIIPRKSNFPGFTTDCVIWNIPWSRNDRSESRRNVINHKFAIQNGSPLYRHRLISHLGCF